MNLRDSLPSSEIHAIASRYGAHSIRVFGSRARGEERAGSDLDLLVEFDVDRNLLDAIGLEQELSDRLGFPVQVLTEGALSPHLRSTILADAVPL